MPELVTIERFTTPWEAHVSRGLLESEGIPASLADEHQIWANGTLSKETHFPRFISAESLDAFKRTCALWG